MKKIAIVTIYDPKPNYGNKLQNYATKHFLSEMGFNVETLITEPQTYSNKTAIKLLLNKISRYILRGKEAQLVWTKEKVFNKFNRNYLAPNDSYLIGKFDSNSYDYFVVGSDQVWNPEWYKSYESKKELFLLTFAKPEQMICMAPSFGVEKLDDKWEPWFQEHLAKFRNISVREEAGANIVRDLIGKEASVVVDPTLLLTRDEWWQIAKKPSWFKNEKYILTYYLGGKGVSVEAEINQVAANENLKVYNLLDCTQPELFISGPSEFVYLIRNAELIMTDSFHACVFSIIFNKPFKVFSRQGTKESMNSRIDTLLKKLKLERKAEWSQCYNELFEAEYADTYSMLEIEKEKAIIFLKDSLQIAEKQ